MDSEQLDAASGVENDRFKDVEVQMNGAWSRIEILKDGLYKEIGY
ncbi:hypothetical protein [Alkalihalobacillus deserti]|nr:hypothetical protein [Alkalihalobacillus deserti]